MSRVRAEEAEALLGKLAAAVTSVPAEAVDAAAELILKTWRRGGTVYVFGNGGSASTASHIACDFMKNTRRPGVRPLRCHSLSDNAALMTALANDDGYERVFVDQIEALARPGDVAVAISVSGTSRNVVAAGKAAGRLGVPVVAMTGAGGGDLGRIAEVLIEVGSSDFGCVETAHVAVEHALVHRLREAMQRESGGDR